MPTEQVLIESVFEDGYWWVVIPDELWETATITDYNWGYPRYV